MNINTNHSRKVQKNAERLLRSQEVAKGDGKTYIFSNNTPGELVLPKAHLGGSRHVAKGATFKGDSYFFTFVKTNDVKYLGEDVMPLHEEKLITEQPPTVTDKGAVEHIVARPKQKPKNLGENSKEAKIVVDDILLNESPDSGIVVME